MGWIFCCVFFLIALAFAVKYLRLRKNIKEISEKLLTSISNEDEFGIIDLPKDKYANKLLKEIANGFVELRKIKANFIEGDRELKDAVINITHDLKTPLTAIYGYLDLLEKEDKNESVEKYIYMISNRVNAINLLTEELFRYTIIAFSCADSFNTRIDNQYRIVFHYRTDCRKC